MQDILSMTLPELQAAVQAMGESAFRAKQLYHWLHVRKVTNFSKMTNLSSAFCTKLESIFCINRLFVVKRLASCIDNTVKYLYRLPDGQHVETVLMQYHHGWRLCISTQVGCKMGCRFCASTIAGYVRHLKASEMLLQIDETERNEKIHISGLVLMGIGEPLDNFENVIRFLDLLSDPDGRQMSLRHVTISTCGLVPEIRKLADRKTGLTLAVSLHQAEDEKRSSIMPVNRKYPLAELMKACQYYFKTTGRRVTYEYAVMEGENDSLADAQKLAALLNYQQAHVNLIPVNPIQERQYYATRRAAKQFMQYLEQLGIHATVRRTLGSDIEAACGQLRHEADCDLLQRGVRRLRCATATDVGLIRDENQDEVLAKDYQGGILAVVCDGMGGEQAGSIASKMAIHELFDHFSAGYQKGMDAEQIRALLLSSVSAANSVIYSSAKMDYQNYGMGTTCVAAFAEQGWLSIVNVGDSRAYLIEDNQIRQITSDHTVVNLLYQQGRIEPEEMENHPQRNMLTRAVGVERVVKPDYYHIACKDDFMLLLCSDGLSSFCSEQELLDTMQQQSFMNLPQALVNLALDKGGRDNISLAVITN